MWGELTERCKELFHMFNGKKVVIWGYGHSGHFLEHLLKRYHREISYIIDKKPLSNKLNMFNPILLNELNPDEYYILLTFPKDEQVSSKLHELGYRENYNYAWIVDIFYGEESGHHNISYIYWLEWKYGLKLNTSPKELAHTVGENGHYSPGCDYSVMDIINQFTFNEDDKLFDFGCGKGYALILFYGCGIQKIGGWNIMPKYMIF